MLDPATKTSDSYDSYEARDYGSRARKAAQNYTKYKSWNGSEVKFGAEINAAEESGICSPPLWTTSPPRSPPQQRPPQNHYRSLSPTSRTQAIARGQTELMEMVRNMPEACYELSLRDLVEKKPAMVEIRQESRVEERDTTPISNEVLFRREDSKKKKNDKRAQVIRRSKSIDSGGFYLKMVFPVSLGSKKKKKNDSVTNTSAKVSPKPPAPDGSAKGVDKEWWKKRFSVSSESESSRSISNSESMKSSGSGSSSSSSSSRSSIRRRSGGCCWSFIHTKKNQTRSK